MKIGLSFLLLFSISLFITKTTQAIIFLPALILIPISHLIAILIGGFSLPAVGIGLLWSNLSKSPPKRTLAIVFGVLAVVTLVLVVLLTILNPDRPFF